MVRTEADAGILLPHILTLLIGEEHVGGEATLGGIGIWMIAVVSGGSLEAQW